MKNRTSSARHGHGALPARAIALCLALGVCGTAAADEAARALESVVLINGACRNCVGYGESVAVDGDTIMIGNTSGSYLKDRCGYVDVYTLVEGQWELTQQLFTPRPSSNRFFGHDIALSKDTAVISTLRWGGVKEAIEEHPADQAGVCYEFKRIDGLWTFKSAIVGSERRRYDNFGCSVDMDGDILVIGASPGAYGQEQTGAVYLFVRDTDARWKQQCKFVSDDPATARTFGERVRIDGGIVAVLGGNWPQYPVNSAVHIYEFVGTEWIKSATLVLPKQSYASADSFDVCDNTIVVGDGSGSPRPLSPPSGGAYVFARDNGTWRVAATLDPGPDAELSDFGSTVVLDGKWLAIGAPGYGYNKNSAAGGAVFFYERRADEFKYVDKIAMGEPKRHGSRERHLDIDAETRRVIIGDPGGTLHPRPRECTATLVTLSATP